MTRSEPGPAAAGPAGRGDRADGAGADGRDAAERPAVQLLLRAGLVLLAAALALRLFSNNGVELLAPGAQLLFAAVPLAAAGALGAGRALGRRPALGLDHRAALPLTLALLAWLALGAPRAAHADLAWRTVVTAAALLALAAAARDAAREPGLLAPLVGWVLGCVVVGAALGVHQELVETRALRADWAAGRLADELAVMDDQMRTALWERIHGAAAAGPYLLPNLLACAVATALPLVVVGAATGRGPGRAALALGGLVLALALALARSKGGFLAAGGALACLALLDPRLAAHRRRLAAGALALGGLGALGGLAAWWRAPELQGVGMSLTVRLEYWAAGLGIWRDFPLAGAGPNQFRAYFGAYKTLRAEEALHAHNALVQALCEVGLVGTALGLACLVTWALPGLRAALAHAAGAAPPAGATPAAGAAPRVPPPRAPTPGWAVACGLGGHALALLLLAAFGDAYALEHPGALLAIALGPPLGALAWCRAAPPTGPRLAAAAVAGLVGFLLDGLTDFGLHFPATLLLALLVVALAPALGGADAPAPGGADAPAPAPARAVERVAAALALAGALALLALVVPPALEADALRGQADAAHERALLALRDGRDAEAAALLDLACADYAAADALRPLARAALGWAAAEARRGRLERAVAAAERAVVLEPRSAEAWTTLGALRRDLAPPDWAGARAAHARAVEVYPGHPRHLLDAARAAAAHGRALPAGAARREALDEARALYGRALEAAATTRLHRLAWDEAERAAVEAERAALDAD